MTQPESLKSSERLLWSVGTGSDVWAIIQAAVCGDLAGMKRLVEKEPSLVRCQPDDPAWATPPAWARRRGPPEVAAVLVEHSAT